MKLPRPLSDYSGYDIIGDVHGCAWSVETLLQKLGYSKVNGVYAHPERLCIFIGDIVDRGPRIREALHLVRDMVDSGFAILLMGNHEYNALCYCTHARAGSATPYLRAHNPRNDRMIADTLEAFRHHDHEWNDFLDWFRTLPLLLQTPDFRAVHACWDQKLIDAFLQQFPDAVIDDDFLHASVVRESFAGHVMDRLLRGTDLPLPDGRAIHGRDGLVRSFFRTRFWAHDPQTYADVVFQPDSLPDDLLHRPLSDAEKKQLLSYPATEPPVFVGHYWLEGTPAPLLPNVACLDYSAVKFGRMVAYRYDREPVLRADKFVWVDVVQGMPDPSGKMYREEIPD